MYRAQPLFVYYVCNICSSYTTGKGGRVKDCVQGTVHLHNVDGTKGKRMVTKSKGVCVSKRNKFK